MSRDRRRTRVPAEPSDDIAPAPSLAGSLVGYRLLRRIASGERADVYLAAADVPDHADGHPGSFAPLERGAEPPVIVAPPPLVALRVYPASVSNESVAFEIEAMSTDAGGTLPALYDVASLDDGRCCLAVERIGGVAVSRILTERTLSAGEAVTILAPVAVAVADLASRGFVHTRLAASDLLLDDAGRPRLVGLGALRRLPGPEQAAERTALLRAGHVALAELFEDVAAAVRPPGVLDDAVDLIRGRLDARPFQPCEADLERRLFAAAAPAPIAGVEVRPRATSRLPARISAPMQLPGASDDGAEAQGHAPVRPSGMRALVGLAQLPDDFGERLAAAADSIPGARTSARLGAAIRAKRRSLAVGGLIGGGALVLMLTLVPPATAGGASESGPSAEPTSAAATSPSVPAEAGTADAGTVPAESTGEPVEGTDGDDAAAATRWLLERRAECFATLDLGCLDAVLQSGSAIEAADRAAILAARDGADSTVTGYDVSTVQVTAEMGDAVLIGVTGSAPEREPASLLVVRGEAGWRLREIFD